MFDWAQNTPVCLQRKIKLKTNYSLYASISVLKKLFSKEYKTS